tara:strand:- start:117 stop:917 length:801 start_codon:yes stop_codon:yes gene_type:complete
MTFQSAIYRGEVVHDRRRPKHHRLRYNVFTMLLDIDELPELDRGCRLFAYNRWSPLAFYDADHGATTGAPLRPWVEDRLKDAGQTLDVGSIRLLCYPRLFGYVFNPISVYFCYRKDGILAAILYEVCNTFHERHTYVIPVTDPALAVIKQDCGKSLYVSPFIGMNTDYKFRILPPAESVSIVIRQEDADGLLLAASFRGDRCSLTDQSMARCLCAFPLMTFKITAAIYWEAAKLWFKGFSIFPHKRASSLVQSSIGNSSPNKTRTG